MPRIPLLLALAALSFLPVLALYMIGEEGIYTISSMEMRFNGNALLQTLYGNDLHRPPLMNWLVMPLAEVLGWTQVLVAARLVSILATLGMAATLYGLCNKLFGDKGFSQFAALAFLAMADVSLYRGWLAYTDPTFALFTFGAMAALMVAALEKHRGWLLISVLLLFSAMISKAFTAYIFYGTAALVLLMRQPTRNFLLSPQALLIFALALGAPYAWFVSLPQVGGHGSSMLNEILRKLTAIDAPDYFTQLAIFPFETAFRLSPVVLLAIYLLLRKRVTQTETAPFHFRDILLITLLCFLPYWLSPQSSIRYLMPIYPFFALLGARLIWRAGESGRVLALRWFAGLIVFKFIFVLVLAPHYQSHFRGENYAGTAQEIMKRTEGFTLHAADSRSIGLNIIGYIDIKRWPSAPLLSPPAEWTDGFILTYNPDEALGYLAETYQVAGDQTFLLCRGAACNTVARP